MARGFESKSVESQQEEAQRTRTLKPAVSPDERARRQKREALELALAAKRRELEAAKSDAHRAYLQRAIADLSNQIQPLLTPVDPLPS